ncbi:MAG TPA: dihydroorotate dehydrogenase [Candidatus Acidoferrales bacterium]|nr:dihydroorotate dehydrogenase [Candidatus Acidoferrales bacterium]
MSSPASARRPTDVDLSVRIGTLLLSNPVIAASGTFGYGIEFSHLVDLNSLGGIVVKGLSAQPLTGAPVPRLCETTGGMLNAVGLQNIGVHAFVAEKLPVLRKYRTAIIANVFGYTIDEYVEVIHVLEDAEGVAGYELNISCPNVDQGGSEFGVDPLLTSQVVTAARRAAVKRPLWVKLAPNADVKATARAAEAAGADALTVANTYPAMALDPATGSSKLGRLTGGLSGPAIKPLTVRLVYDVSRTVGIPVIGLGGIESLDDVLEYFRAGATAIQIGTAHFADPRASERVVEELWHHCESLTINNINQLREVSK